MVAQAMSGTNYFNLWLKWAGYSVVDINVLPTAGNALSIAMAFIFGMITDATGHRLAMIIIIELLVMLSNVLLSVWYIPTRALLFAFYLSYVGAAGQPIIIVGPFHVYHFSVVVVFNSSPKAWGQELNRGDPNLKQLLVATGNVFTYCFSTWLPRKSPTSGQSGSPLC